MFEEFIRKVSYQLTLPLPGDEVQCLFAPSNRLPSKEYRDKNIVPKKGGVLVLLFPSGDDIKMVLILRSVYSGVHSGQVGFPGGRYEKSDKTLVNTAVRESEEEIGVDRNSIRIVGSLTPLYIPPSNFLVSPCVGCTLTEPDFIIDEKEVAEVIIVSLNELTDKSIIKSKRITIDNGLRINVPFYDIRGHHIWGATAMIISEFIEVIRRVKP